MEEITENTPTVAGKLETTGTMEMAGTMETTGTMVTMGTMETTGTTETIETIGTVENVVLIGLETMETTENMATAESMAKANPISSASMAAEVKTMETMENMAMMTTSSNTGDELENTTTGTMATGTADTATSATLASGPEHNYSKNGITSGTSVTTRPVEDDGQIKLGLIRSYFEGLKSEADDDDAEGSDDDKEDDSQANWQSWNVTPSNQSVPIADRSQDPSQIVLPVAQQVQTKTQKGIEPEDLYTVELQTYSTVGEVTKPMMVTVLNVASLTFKCGKCKMPYKKQLPKTTLRTFQRHHCVSAAVAKLALSDRLSKPTTNYAPIVSKRAASIAASLNFPKKRIGTRASLRTKAPAENADTTEETKAVRNISRELCSRKGRPIRKSARAEAIDKLSDDDEDAGVDEDNVDRVDDDQNSYDGINNGESDHGEGLKLEPPETPAITPQQMVAKDFCIQCYYKLEHRCVKRRKKGEPKEINKCSLCDKVYKTKISLDQHMRVHTGERPFKCETCEKAFRRSSTLFEHMRIHGGEKRFLCYVCGRAFLRKSDQTAHIRRHTNDYKYRCADCNKGFKGKVQLEVHMRKHTGEMPYLCTVCGRKFKHTSGLRTHMRYHEIAENPLRCTECGITYEDVDELRMHTCAAGKQHLCTVCGRTFPQPSGLKHHMKSHTRPNPSICKSCHETFANEVELQMHQDENIVRCATCDKTIKEARLCMLNKLPGNTMKGKKFKCWDCHSQQKQLQPVVPQVTLGMQMPVQLQ